MNSLERNFRKLISIGRKLFLPYVTLGDPDLKSSCQITKTLARAGADAIEIGIPFSDPIADGPTIQRATSRALANGINLKTAFKVLKKLKNELSIPILFMSYYNPIFRMGEENFFQKARENRLDGIIIPDLAVEEASDFSAKARAIDLASIFFISPTTPIERAKKIARISTGFIYYISLTGVTGAREKLAPELIKNLKLIRKLTSKPICVGFGISNPQQVRLVKNYVDGIIIGSAIVDIIERNLAQKNKLLKEIAHFCKRIRTALDEENFSP